MAMRTVTETLSDLSGAPTDRTIRLGLAEADYEIDLTDAEARELFELLQPYLKVARKTKRARSRS